MVPANEWYRSVSAWHGGKGSKPRPVSVSQQQFSDNWDRIFANKTKDKKQKQTKEETDAK